MLRLSQCAIGNGYFLEITALERFERIYGHDGNTIHEHGSNIVLTTYYSFSSNSLSYDIYNVHLHAYM